MTEDQKHAINEVRKVCLGMIVQEDHSIYRLSGRRNKTQIVLTGIPAVQTRQHPIIWFKKRFFLWRVDVYNIEISRHAEKRKDLVARLEKIEHEASDGNFQTAIEFLAELLLPFDSAIGNFRIFELMEGLRSNGLREKSSIVTS